ncbi:MAG: c-type cytochrome domain-containing protein [Planctomycetaceae bacterium]
MRSWGLSLSVVLIVGLSADVASSSPNAKQRKELASIRRDLAKVSGLIRKRKIDAARKLVDDAEKRLEKVVKDARLIPRDRTVRGLRRLIRTRRAIVLRAQGSNPQTAGVSFEKQVAPILKANCAKCHGANNPKGGLRLDSGGAVRAIVTAGNAKTSKLIQRLVTRGKQRMPKDGKPLKPAEIATIALWINQGARVAGSSTTGTKTTGTKTTGTPKPKTPVNVTIPKPTGNETVSFTKDIAPFMVNLCVNCHNDRRKSGGLSLETFEKLMIGGKSGRIVLPGNLDGSRLWDLAGKQKPFKMPRGHALITRSNHRNLRKWIEEGAKFDGKNAKATLRSLVPTDEELKTARFAKMSSQEFAQYRRKRTETLWDRVLPKEKPRSVESKEFFVYGNVSAARLEEIDKWAEKHADYLRKLFRDKSPRLFKGKLAIIVMKDRFSYEEFNTIVAGRDRVPKAMIGHSVVDKLYEDAYIVVQNIGDEASDSNPGMNVLLMDHLTGAFMKRGGDKLPDWVLRGTGLALAERVDPKNAYIASLRGKVPGLLQNVGKPEAIFANGTFAPGDVGAVGFTLVDFLLRGGQAGKFSQFLNSLHRGTSMKATLKNVYQADVVAVARGYMRSLSRRRRQR